MYIHIYAYVYAYRIPISELICNYYYIPYKNNLKLFKLDVNYGTTL